MQQPQDSSSSLPPTTSASDSQILVAEDNLVNQKVMAAVLKRLGYTYEMVENGIQAVQAVGEKNYKLVLMDMQMPEMNGLEATKAIRARGGALADLPIIALTANAMSSDRDACLSAGMNDFLSKPLTFDALSACLAKWMSGNSSH